MVFGEMSMLSKDLQRFFSMIRYVIGRVYFPSTHFYGVCSKCKRNSSAFGFLLQASSHAKPLRGGLMHFYLYVISRTLQPVQSPGLNCNVQTPMLNCCLADSASEVTGESEFYKVFCRTEKAERKD